MLWLYKFSGDRVAMYSDLGYKNPVSAVDFHPHEHAVAFCSFSEHHPVLIYKYDFKSKWFGLISVISVME